MFSKPLAIVELIFAGLSVIMIFVNHNSDMEIITGYAMAVIAVVLELFIPSIAHFVFVWIESLLFIKGGNKIRSKSLNLFNLSITKTKEEMVENTDWFYGNGRKK